MTLVIGTRGSRSHQSQWVRDQLGITTQDHHHHGDRLVDLPLE